VSFPRIRLRRLRMLSTLRDIVAETRLTPENFMMPIFVDEELTEPKEIPSMPGYHRHPVSSVIEVAQRAVDLGIRSVLLFGVPKSKDERGSSAYNSRGAVQEAVRSLKSSFGSDLVVATDVCLCQYTSHGHCGLVVRDRKCRGKGCWKIDNDATLEILGKVALSHAEAGADIVAPSGMMDGMVMAIREALDREGYEDVAIMSYSVKYASSFYGPFREAANSAPQFGDRRSHQMDPRNAFESIKEAALDVEEGADILMVKPALAYLDVIRLVKSEFPHYPLAAYNVSGEYSMVKAAAAMGWIDERKVMFEILTSIRRAGADIIITYHAVEAAKLIREGYNPF